MSSESRSTPGRRFGYIVAVVVNVVLLVLINARPGWQVVPFLTADAAQVVTLVNVSLGISVLANLVYLVRDPAWLRAIVDVLTTAVSLVAAIRMQQLFPFDFGESSIDWPFWTHLGLWFLILVLGIALVVQLVRFFRAVAATG